MKEFLEHLINRTSFLTIKPEFGGEWSSLCHNAGKKLCDKCQQEQCDAAGGGIPEPSEYKWRVMRRRKER